MKRFKNLLLVLMMAPVFFSFSHKSMSGYKPGDQVQDFTLKNIDGSMYSMASDPSAQGFIVVFTCNHCPFSVAYEDRIINLDKKFRPKGFPVVAINPNDAAQYEEDSYENMIKRAGEKKFPFPYLHDETQEVARRFGATRTPHVFVLQRDTAGKLYVRYIGAIDNNSKDADAATSFFVADAVNALMKGKEVPVASTASVGCGIKWKK